MLWSGISPFPGSPSLLSVPSNVVSVRTLPFQSILSCCVQSENAKYFHRLFSFYLSYCQVEHLLLANVPSLTLKHLCFSTSLVSFPFRGRVLL